jgi:hypothetical protein
MSCIRKRPLRLRPKARKRNLPRIRIFHKVECEYRRTQIAELATMLFGSAVSARAQTDEWLREELRNAVFMTVTDPQDLDLLPELFAPASRDLQ